MMRPDGCAQPGDTSVDDLAPVLRGTGVTCAVARTQVWRTKKVEENADAMPRQPAGETPSAGRAARRLQDREIARLAVPAFAALVSEPLFLLADAAIVGHLGTAQLAALGIAGTVVQTVIGAFVFLAYGTTSAVARNLGADRRGDALGAGVDGIWLALVIGGLAALATLAMSSPLVDWFSPSTDVRGFALTYLRIAAFGIPALLMMFAATGVLRGLQDTRTPLLVAVSANTVNIGLNVGFVYGLGWGIAGSALGTLAAQTAGAGALVLVVARVARRAGAPLFPNGRGMEAAWRAGIPLVVRTLSLRATLVLATYVAASISTVAVAAHQVAFTIWTFLAFALDAIAIAGQAITGRLLGAGDAAGAREAATRMTWWGVASGVVLGAAVIAVRPLLVPLFTGDAAVQHALSAVLLIVGLQQPVAGVVFVLDGVLIGAGDGRYLAWVGLLNFAVFAPLALAVWALDGGLVQLWLAFVVFMVMRMVTLLVRARGERWLVLGAVAEARAGSGPAPGATAIRRRRPRG
jgi:putative MATE family efflux protein